MARREGEGSKFPIVMDEPLRRQEKVFYIPLRLRDFRGAPKHLWEKLDIFFLKYCILLKGHRGLVLSELGRLLSYDVQDP